MKPAVVAKPVVRPVVRPPPPFKGLKRALLVGINYIGTPSELAGCINDVNNMSNQIKNVYPMCKDIRCLTDLTAIKPTRKNILDSITWLINGLKPGENVLFHFSGHGGIVRDKNGDEITGADSCICPLNINGSNDVIIDDELRTLLAMKIPANSKCFVIIDACHSGTAVDLRCLWETSADKALTYKEDKTYSKTNGSVLFLSGCHDFQYAADTVDKNGRPSGALTMALLDTWTKYGPAIKFKYLLWDIRTFLKENGYTQVPQIATGNYMDPNTIFDLRI